MVRLLVNHQCRDRTSQDIVTAVRQLVLIANDELIAGIFSRNKLTTGRDNRWTRERVTALRSHHKIPVYCPAEQVKSRGSI
jgi:alkyl hydroperoxide reductase subunit AhpC